MDWNLHPEQRELWLNADPERRPGSRFASAITPLPFILVLGVLVLVPLLSLLARWP
jgi:hypothetical protein